MNKRLRSLLARKEALIHDCEAINAAPEGEGEGEDQELTAEQKATLDENLATLKALNVDIKREQDLEAEFLTAESYLVPDNASLSGGAPKLMDDPKLGFRSFGEFCSVLVKEGQSFRNPSQIADARLATIVAAAPTTYGSEGVGADGGFLVAPEFGREIYMHSLDEDAILPLTDNQNISGNSITYPKDETTPWGTNGIRVYWEAEGAQATQTKPVVGYTTHRLHKLMGLVPLTDELMQDGPAMGGYVNDALSRSIRWKSNDAFVNGTGAGQPEGILAAGALVSVTGETTSPAASFTTTDVVTMYQRMLPSSMGRAVWMMNSDVLSEVLTMTLGNQPIYIPPGRLSDSPAGSLLGRPIMLSQHCQTLGTVGDVIFVDWMEYRTITKAGGIETATSMHLYFDAGATAFRATFRVDGASKIASSVTPANGSNTLSPFVVLATRS